MSLLLIMIILLVVLGGGGFYGETVSAVAPTSHIQPLK